MRACPYKYTLLTLSLSFHVLQNTLQCFPLGVKSSLEQQVAELKVNAEVKSTEPPTDLDDKRLSSGKAICRPMGALHLWVLAAVSAYFKWEKSWRWLTEMQKRIYDRWWKEQLEKCLFFEKYRSVDRNFRLSHNWRIPGSEQIQGVACDVFH